MLPKQTNVSQKCGYNRPSNANSKNKKNEPKKILNCYKIYLSLYQYKIEKNLLFTQQQLKMMNNFSLSSSVWLLVATVSLAACQSDDQAGYVSMPTMSRTAAHVAQPSKLAASVSLDEASHAASSFAPQRMLGKSPSRRHVTCRKSRVTAPHLMDPTTRHQHGEPGTSYPNTTWANRKDMIVTKK